MLISFLFSFAFRFSSEFQRIARRDKKAFLNDQCKAIEKNNRMGKTRDLFKKIRDTKGTFHAKIGLIKESISYREGKKRKLWDISCKDGLDKGQKWYEPNRSRRY